MSALPPELERLVEEALERARLPEEARSEVRADLTRHLLDGLERGRSVDELIERFGDPAVVGPIMARSPSPSPSVRPPSQPDGILATLMDDARHGLRALLRAPTLALTATVVLALGVGANTVVFTVLNELLLRPLPVAEPEGLVDVWADIEGGNSFLGVSWQDYVTFRSENRVLEELVAFTATRTELGDDGPTVVAQMVTPAYFDMLGLTASLGTTRFDRGGDFGDPAVAVIAHGFWQDAFGGDPTVVGSTIRVRDVPATVIGVGPPGYTGHFIGFPTDLWLPVTTAPAILDGFDPDDRASQPFEMIGRVRAGVTPAVAAEALNVIAAELEAAHPDTNRGHRVGVTATTGLDHSLHAAVTAFVLILTAISLLVLIVACLNVGSVLLVRAMARERELAVRIALGAGRRRIVRLILTESTLLAGLGAGAGLLVAWRLNEGLARTLRAVAPGLGLDLSIDWRVLGLTATAAVVATALTTLAPTLHVLGKSPAGVLRSRGGGGRSGTRLRSALVVGQVAVSVVLVTSTGLFVRALVEGGRADYGFDADGLGSFALVLPPESTDRHSEVEREVLDALRALPGVAGVSVGSSPPLGVARTPLEIDVPGVLPPAGRDRNVVDARVVRSDYLETVGVSLIAGRDIAEADDRSGARVAVVSQAFGDRFWPGEEPVAKTFVADGEPVTVVGLAADARFIVQDDTPDPLLYLSRAGTVAGPRLVVVRAADPEGLTSTVDASVEAIVSGHPRIVVRTARQTLDAALLPQRMAVIIIGAMGLAALFLSAVGLYGLVQFTVSRDTHELGVRLALGGSRGDLARVVLGKGLRLVAIGLVGGVAVALLVTPSLGGFLSGVSPSDPFTYGVVVACFAIVSLLASWMPARRALRIEAVEALRGE